MDHARLLRRCFEAATTTVRAERCLPPVPPHPGRTGVVAIGKAGADMARVALGRMDEAPTFALAVVPYGHVPTVMPPACEVIEAGHPHPDAQSLRAGRRALELADTLGPADRLLALVSGGGSAVLCAPAEGVAFEEKREAVAALHRAGAPIGAINAVRAGLSAVKGGRLGAAANGAEVLAYVISDVPGDDPARVASGPTVPPSGGPDPAGVLRSYGVAASPAVAAALARPPPPAFRAETHLVATADDALAAAAKTLAAAGYEVRNEGGAVEGDAAALGRRHALLAHRLQRKGRKVAILSGGETTVALPARPGRGGRNTTYLLSLAITLNGRAGIHALAADTDGIDGTEDAAGGTCGPDSLRRMRAAGVDPLAALVGADSYAAFAASGELLVTGPTLTNVNDLRVVLVG